MRNKVTIVGAGNVGATAAQRVFDRGYADVVLVDIVDGLPQGKALDMLQSGPVIASDASVIGTNGYEETAGSDVVVITMAWKHFEGIDPGAFTPSGSRVLIDYWRMLDPVRFAPVTLYLPLGVGPQSDSGVNDDVRMR